MREREIVVREPSTPQRIASAAWSLATSVARGGRAANVVSGAHALMSSVLERLQPCARPTTENGSQCVGSSECSRLTELMPSSAASPSIMVAWPAPTAMSLYVRSLLSASGRPLRDVSVAHASPGSGLVRKSTRGQWTGLRNAGTDALLRTPPSRLEHGLRAGVPREPHAHAGRGGAFRRRGGRRRHCATSNTG